MEFYKIGKFIREMRLSNSDAKDSICNRAELQAVFASAALLLHSEHSLQPRLVADTIYFYGLDYSPLNSAKLSSSSEVTLNNVVIERKE